MKLSIIILNYKTAHLLRLLLKNLLALNIPVPYEIIVIDNASGDGSAEMVQKLYSNNNDHVVFIANPKNTGHAHGNNVGIKVAKGEYLLIMNTDVIFSAASDIIKLLEYMNTNRDVGLLGPRLRNADGSIQNSCFRPYSDFTPLYRRTPLGKLQFAQQDLNRHLMKDFDHASIREVDWILGACFVVRKAILDNIGPFNEQFFLYFADFELCDRIRAHNHKVVYYPDVDIIHYHKRESAQNSIWGGLGSLLNYVTRVHLKDWLTYRKISKQGYGINT